MRDPERAALAAARRIVVKIGSRLLTDSPAGRPAALADEIAALRAERGLRAVVVTSGAIGLGMRALRMAKRPADIPSLQAAAAVGQRALLTHWGNAFAAHDIPIGQILLTHDDIRDRRRFLNARHAIDALLAASVVPVVNENDTVGYEEIKYGDNDLLAALVCNLVGADALIVLTDVEGLRGADGRRIPVVRDVDAEAVPVAGGSTTGSPGSGGMASKVQAAKLAGRTGAAAVVVPGAEPRALTRALAGEDIGTLFVPPGDRLTSRKHWIAFGSRPAGAIAVDAGARAALVDRRTSLLPAGVTGVSGEFDAGDLVSVVDAGGTEFARGLACYGAADLRRIAGRRSADIAAILGYKYVDEVIRRDDLVIL
ncbi:MAG: glutamate 5-kinase [Deltaproteobacteria bacterium]|nr:MAG: glutamate 5-kinase [Deltaproteobacteria bacterium]